MYAKNATKPLHQTDPKSPADLQQSACNVSQTKPNRTQIANDRTLAFAAALLVEDSHTDEEISRALGVTRRTLARWKLRPDVAFALQTQELLQLRAFFRDRPMFWDDEEVGPLP